ncbi:MAG: cytochrome d ubiquinol oxidase subunit II [Hyphomicrobium sp.]
MDDLSYWLPLIWVGLLAVAVILYVILDGFDLGIGILFPFYKHEDDRDIMMNSVAPFWDGNETWLILGGGGLFVAFPTAYGVIMSGFYLPILIMLLALVLRGVAFEFRWVAKPKHKIWDISFAGGSITAAFMQGVILGGLLHGLPVENGMFSGHVLGWMNLFPFFVGLATVCGYALLGATWLIMRTEGEVADDAREQAKFLLIMVGISLCVISIWTPFAEPRIWERWFSIPNFFFLSPVPILTALTVFLTWRGLIGKHENVPFVGTIFLFLLGFIGLAVSTLPYLVPPSLTIWEAAAHPSSQLFMLVGTSVLLPIILAYTAFVYWTFRGKVRSGEGYH